MKNKLSLLIGGVLVALLVTVVVGATSAYAQGPTDALAHGRGPGGGRGFGGSLTWLTAAAEALDMPTDELITELRSGKTLEEIAEAAGIDYEDVQAAVQESRQTEIRERIQQALDDETITQAHADWLFEGLENGFIGGGNGFGFGGMHGKGFGPGPLQQPTQENGG
jgi:hypothetical protein